MATARYSSSVTTTVECLQVECLTEKLPAYPTKPVSSFPRFSELPAELRFLIWKLALPGPRVVLLEPRLKSPALRFCYRVRSDVHIDNCESFFNGILDGLSFREIRELVEAGTIGPMERGSDIFFRSCCPRPEILDVCHEARREASMFYQNAFGTVCGFPSVRFDYEIDSLFLDWGDGRIMLDYRPSCFSEGDLQKVQNLVLYERQSRLESEGYGSAESWVAEVLQSFTGVKKITRSIFGGDCKHQGEAVVLKNPIPLEIQNYWLANKVNPTDESDFLGALAAGVFEIIPLDLAKLKLEIEAQVAKSGFRSAMNGVQGVISVPEIDYKIAMAPDFKTQLDAGETRYWDGVKRGEIARAVEVDGT